MTRSRLDEASIDPAVLGFTALVTLATSVVFGLFPALQASRTDLRQSIHGSGRGGAGATREHASGWLITAEVALALVLLTAAGLTARSFLRVLAVQPGFRTDSVLAFDVDLPGARYSSDAAKVAFFQQLTEHLQALPGAGSVGAISCLPLSGGDNLGNFVIEGEPPVKPGNEPIAERRWVTPGYFATMGIPIRQGRVFTPQDSVGQPNTAVINESLANKFFKTREVLGSRLWINGSVRTIVGVVSDVRSASLEGPVRFQVYLPYAQDPWSPMTVVLRTSVDPMALASAVRGELKQNDAALPAAKMRTLEQVISGATSVRRFNMALLAFFACAALVLTVIGIYGVVAFVVGRRRREIAVRMALGAQRKDIHRLIFREGMKPVLWGIVAGLLGSLAASRVIVNQLYGISGADPVTLASIISVLMIAAILACYIPARRATRIHPMVALRNE
jgi:putative ABC transport system permease protein